MSTAQQAAFDKALLEDFDSIAGSVGGVDVRKVSFRVAIINNAPLPRDQIVLFVREPT